MSSLSQNLLSQFHKEGWLILPNFYSLSLINQVNSDILELTHVVSERVEFTDNCDYSLPTLLSLLSKHDRASIGKIYDAAKMLPSIHKVINNRANFDLFMSLRPKSMPGIATNGHGVRIDLPNEERFSAPWHQEFPNQFRSLDGLVFWIPLMHITQDLGPVHILPRSHNKGVLDVELTDKTNKSGAYAMSIKGIDSIIASSNAEVISPLCKQGDLIILDFLTLHRSGINISKQARMSLQFRFFNYLDPVGTEIGWVGSYASGKDFGSVKDLVKFVNSSKSS